MDVISSVGLPITAFFPFTIIGRSINFGNSTIALIISKLESVFPFKFSFQMASFFRTKSIGAMFKSLIKSVNSCSETGDFK